MFRWISVKKFNFINQQNPSRSIQFILQIFLFELFSAESFFNRTDSELGPIRMQIFIYTNKFASRNRAQIDAICNNNKIKRHPKRKGLIGV